MEQILLLVAGAVIAALSSIWLKRHERVRELRAEIWRQILPDINRALHRNADPFEHVGKLWTLAILGAGRDVRQAEKVYNPAKQYHDAFTSLHAIQERISQRGRIDEAQPPEDIEAREVARTEAKDARAALDDALGNYLVWIVKRFHRLTRVPD